MDLELKNNNTTDALLSSLYSAQLIANTFAKGLEDNSCLVISTVQLHQRIKDYTEDVKTLIPPVYTEPSEIVKEIVNNRPGEGVSISVQDAVKSAKEKCFNCKLELPKLNFDIDLDFSLGELQIHLELYKSLFKTNFELDPCQTIEVFKYQCIPDILKLISLLLTAYLAINTIKKLSGLSLSFFIKGIISVLLTKLLSSVNISLNLGKTNLSCFIEYVKMISSMLPSTDNITKNLNTNQIIGLIQVLPISTIEGLMNGYVGPGVLKEEPPNYSYSQLQNLAGAIPKEEIALLFNLNNSLSSISSVTDNLNGVSKKIDRYSKDITKKIDRYSEDISNKLKETQEGLDNVFKQITDTVEVAVKTFNDYINQIFSLKSYFECETARSSDNLVEIMTEIKNMISVINLLSSLVYALAKKEARGICKTSKSVKQSTVGSSTLTEKQLAIKDLTQDYYKKVVEVGDSDSDDLELLIYKKPIQIGLPKISLLDCSIDNFIKEHTLDAILELATKDVLQEQEDTRKIVDKGPWDSFTINVKGTNELQPMIKNLADLLYTPPSASIPPTPTTTPTVLFSDIVKQQKPNYTVDTASIKPNESVKCKSVEDVLNMLDTITRG